MRIYENLLPNAKDRVDQLQLSYIVNMYNFIVHYWNNLVSFLCTWNYSMQKWTFEVYCSMSDSFGALQMLNLPNCCSELHAGKEDCLCLSMEKYAFLMCEDSINSFSYLSAVIPPYTVQHQSKPFRLSPMTLFPACQNRHGGKSHRRDFSLSLRAKKRFW